MAIIDTSPRNYSCMGLDSRQPLLPQPAPSAKQTQSTANTLHHELPLNLLNRRPSFSILPIPLHHPRLRISCITTTSSSSTTTRFVESTHIDPLLTFSDGFDIGYGGMFGSFEEGVDFFEGTAFGFDPEYRLGYGVSLSRGEEGQIGKGRKGGGRRGCMQ